MNLDEAVFMSLLKLPERVHLLEQKIGEQRVLMDILLARSGLDAQAIERAHSFAADAWNQIVEQAAEKSVEKWLATPEGREAHRETQEVTRQRIREFWREDCKKAGRIVPDPTA